MHMLPKTQQRLISQTYCKETSQWYNKSEHTKKILIFYYCISNANVNTSSIQ